MAWYRLEKTKDVLERLYGPLNTFSDFKQKRNILREAAENKASKLGHELGPWTPF